MQVPSIDALKQLAYELKQQITKPTIILGAIINQKPNLAILLDEEIVKSKGLNAGNIVREAAKAMKGGGGGQPHFATAGGSDAASLNDAIKIATDIIRKA